METFIALIFKIWIALHLQDIVGLQGWPATVFPIFPAYEEESDSFLDQDRKTVFETRIMKLF
jgi:hypothetical protein